jgi:ornithine--oxo-acid transaminase
LASSIATAALMVVKEERLAENAARQGEKLRQALRAIPTSRIELVRGKGLLNAIVIEEKDGVTAWDICIRLMENGLLAKPTHGHIIRFAPPLVITDEQLEECIRIIHDTLLSFDV